MVGSYPKRFALWTNRLLELALPGWMVSAFLACPRARALHLHSAQPDQDVLSLPVTLLDQPPNPVASRLTPVDLHIPANRLLKRRITAPAAARGDLVNVAQLDLQRATPFAMDEVTWALSPTRVDGDQAVATQWVARNSDMTRWRAALAGEGYTPRLIWVEGEATICPLADFTATLAPKARLWRRLNVFLLLVTLLGALVAWLAPAWQADRAAQALETDRTRLQSRAIALRQELDTLRAAEQERAQLIDHVLNRPLLSETLREVTVALPDDTWVSAIGYRPDQLSLSGETSSVAAELVLSLTEEGRLGNPQLSGPVSRTASGGERFDLLIDLGKGGGS